MNIERLISKNTMNIFVGLMVIIGVIFAMVVIISFVSAKVKSDDKMIKEKYADNTTDDSKNKIVLYYADWCGHSNNFLPIWKKFINECKSEYPNVLIDTIECSGGNSDMCLQKGIEGFPTVMMYKTDGSSQQFNDNRTVEALLSFVKKNV